VFPKVKVLLVELEYMLVVFRLTEKDRAPEVGKVLSVISMSGVLSEPPVYLCKLLIVEIDPDKLPTTVGPFTLYTERGKSKLVASAIVWV